MGGNILVLACALAKTGFDSCLLFLPHPGQDWPDGCRLSLNHMAFNTAVRSSIKSPSAALLHAMAQKNKKQTSKQRQLHS